MAESRMKTTGLTLSKDELFRLAQFTMEHVGDSIYWVRPDASIAYANQSAASMLGYSRDELLKMRVYQINHQFDENSWTNHWETLTEQGHRIFESEQVTKDGQRIPVEISANLVDFEGELLSCSVIRDLTERKKAETDRRLLLSNEELLNATIRGQENEARRIARDLHDGLGQYLGAAKLQLEALINNNELSPRASGMVLAIESAINESLEETGRISRSLLPVVLEDFGCVKALEQLCESLNEESDVAISFFCNDTDMRMNADVELTLFRLVQESVNNALKHAAASSIEVQLISEANNVILTVEDDGCGFNLNGTENEEVKVGLGLRNLCHRTTLIGGRISMDTSEGKGTAVTVRIPKERTES